MKKAFDLISFYNDIEGIVKRKPIDARHLVLYMHLYLEHYINYICQKKNLGGEKLKERATKLLDKKIITQKAYNHIELIINLRNKLVHDLTITIEEVNKKLDEMDSLFHTNDPDLINVINSADKWQRLHIFSVSLITILYKIMCESYQIKPKYDIRPEVFIHKDKKPTWRMVLLENKS